MESVSTPVFQHKTLMLENRQDSFERLDDCCSTPKRSVAKLVQAYLVNSLTFTGETRQNLEKEIKMLNVSQFSPKERSSLDDFMKKKIKILNEHCNHTLCDYPAVEPQRDLMLYSPDETMLCQHTTTGILMVNKKVRLNLKYSKFANYLRDLDVLHKSTSPYLVGIFCYFVPNPTTLLDAALRPISGLTFDIYKEFMDIGSLRYILDNQSEKIQEDYLAHFSVCVIRGLSCLKNNGLLHNNLKPENILFNSYGLIKLSDYELTNYTQDKATSKVSSRVYLAPERICGVSQPNISSDVWSFGVILFEASTGIYPFAHSSHDSLQSAYITGTVNNTIPYHQNYSDLLDNIVQGNTPELPDSFSIVFRKFISICLNKNQTERPELSHLLNHSYLKNKTNTMEHIYYEWLRSLSV